MSRIGKKPVAVPQTVKVQLKGQDLSVQGPKGQTALAVHPAISISYDQAKSRIVLARKADTRIDRTLHGTMRSLVSNMVLGASQGFNRKLEIHGVGYSAKLNGRVLQLIVGYSEPVNMLIPEGVTVELPNPTLVQMAGPDKKVIGQFAAEVRKMRPPEPYKGKGIRYEGEVIRRKAGKAFVGTQS